MTTPDPYSALVDDLAYSYDGVFNRSEVEQIVADARAHLESTATITQFLPVLVARHAREQLMSRAQASGRIAKAVPELLFVCVHNSGRSQMAAALAEHLSARRVHVRSAGSAPANEINPVVVEALRERGIDLSVAYPKPLSDSVPRAADVIITMGCGDSCPYSPANATRTGTSPTPTANPSTSSVTSATTSRRASQHCCGKFCPDRSSPANTQNERQCR